MRLRTLCLLLASLCLYVTSSAQIEVDYPYNPDSDGNEIISIEDLLDLLPYYGSEFTVDEILIDGVTLVEYLSSLSLTVSIHQELIEELQSLLEQQVNQETTEYITNNYYNDGLGAGSIGALALATAATGHPLCFENQDILNLGFLSTNINNAESFSNVCLPGLFFGESPVFKTYCFYGTNFSSSDLNHLSWSVPSIEDPSTSPGPHFLGGIEASNVNFSNCNLDFASFGINLPSGEPWEYYNYSHQLGWSNLANSSLNNSSFSGVFMAGTSLANTSLKNSHFEHVNCSNCSFSNAVIRNAHFDHIDLSNANFSGATIENSIFTNVRGCNEIQNLPENCECVDQGDGSFTIQLENGITPIADCNPIEYQGYTYDTTPILGRCWFAENLRATSFNNGDALENYLDLSDDFIYEYGGGNPSDYFNYGSQSNGQPYPAGYYSPVDTTSIPGWNCDNWFYQFQPIPPNMDSSIWQQNVGLYYNYQVVIDERNICPLGWHALNEQDWFELGSMLTNDDNFDGYLNHEQYDAFRSLMDYSHWSPFDPYAYCSSGNYPAAEATNGLGLNFAPNTFSVECNPYISQPSSDVFISSHPSGPWNLSEYQNCLRLTIWDINVQNANNWTGAGIRCVQDGE